MQQPWKLWFSEEAKKWEETLPLGNGSLGAMIWGGIKKETIGLNEETLWSGYYKDKNNPRALAALSKVRTLIFEQNYREAEEVIKENMLGEYNETYLPLGNLYFETNHKGEVSNYRRELDFDSAVATVSYTVGKKNYKREYFCSYPHHAMIGRLTGEDLELLISFESMLEVAIVNKETCLELSGKCPEHVDPNYIGDREEAIIQGTRGQEFEGKVEILFCDGIISESTKEDNWIQIKNATEVVFAVSCVRRASITMPADYKKIKSEHKRDYQNLFRRVDLYLGEQLALPTNQRLARLRQGEEDNGLFALYFQYGRYLLIASSRKGSLPANLQGIWNWEMRAPWSSNYTININMQMNYWPAQSCNLSECLEPYFKFLKRLSVEGKKTAQSHYSCRGFVVHHNADYWCNANPVGLAFGEEKGWEGTVSWSMWPMGGAWLTQELLKEYEYNKDIEFLKEMVYPILKEAVLFLYDWLILKDGYYVTCPSTSPENSYIVEDGTKISVTYAATMDLEIIREVFGNFRKTCDLLQNEDELIPMMEERLKHLTPFKVGSYGQLLEWPEEFKEHEPGHRHVSHLYGLFPSELFENNEELREACKISLMHRIKNGGGYTGWSLAWIINLLAILGDGTQAFQYLKQLLTNSTYDNFWDAHPPFQIDGNFGGISAIANMLVQDRGGNLKILPALPKEFKNGYVKGLRIKDRKEVHIEWSDGKLKECNIYECE